MSAYPLPRCDKCDKEFEKLLQCGRCKNAFYCSPKCQTDAWKNHKNVCRRPGKEPSEAVLELLNPKPEKTDPPPAPKKSVVQKEQPVRVEAEDLEVEEEAELSKQFRQELLRETQVVNAQMMTAMQEARGDPGQFLPRVQELKAAYEQMLLDHLNTRSRTQRAKDGIADCEEKEDPHLAAVHLGHDLMKEVVMAMLQRGMSSGSAMDQLDLANNHFNACIVQNTPPAKYALEDDALEGFEPAITRVKEKGFVTLEGLLDDEIASVIYNECRDNFWERRKLGAMHEAKGAADGSFECWLPYPPRKGTSPELEHALRILFGLPHEFAKNGYPRQLKVPTMAHLSCFPRGSLERLHLDFDGDKAGSSSSSSGRELTFVLFLTPGWEREDGGAFRAYLNGDRPGPRPGQATVGYAAGSSRDGEAYAADDDGPASDEHCIKEIWPEAGQCVIFRSRELWHEVLPAKKDHFALTLFVQRAE
eukprot:TRINITY_DN31757_c0_g1_i1.p1 TRINITY_DN31757_c0_g1~~TRINITY_DN31757_c0_g1_i1.p1  ORF type:complete len:475 (-),score=108.63 TRINITY_DN31757_c0_g1_i1:26-1450(-)